MLTFGRLLAAPYVGYLIINQDYPLALGVFVAAGITDMVNINMNIKIKKSYN
jgi:cardiolipin synthase